jgi:uncharacterized membrane-anchored protein
MVATRGRTLARALRVRSGDGRTRQMPVHGVARLGRRTKDLVKRLSSQDIAVIDHLNLDRIAAEELEQAGVRAVINASASSDGSYPNPGPLLLVRAGVPLVDAPGASLFERLEDGDPIALEQGRINRRGELIAEGRLLEAEELARDLELQRRALDHALRDFTENTMSHVREEGELLTGEIDFPDTRAVFRDRHALIVVRGPDHLKDLRALKAYIRDVKPVLIGVDGGANTLLAEGFSPDIVLGDMDSAGEGALRSGAQLIVHAYPDGRAPGAERLEQLGVEHQVVAAAGTSEDVAMLLASEKGAELIVAVGAHFNLVEFLEKRRAGMSSTFLTRLRIGEILVDAKGVSRLYNPGPSLAHLGGFFALFVLLAVIVILSTPALENVLDLLWLKLKVVLGL